MDSTRTATATSGSRNWSGLRLTLKAEDGMARLTVEDTGIGIEPEHLEKIFDPFWQGNPSLARKGSGTGLGLAICRRIVDLLGGEIEVTSEVGSGTSFVVRLPIGK